MIAYLTLLGTALAAFAGAPVWTALIGAAVLLAISFSGRRRLTERFAQVGHLEVLHMAMWQSAGHALLASGLIYLVGLASRMVLLAH